MSKGEITLSRNLAVKIFESVGLSEDDLDYILSAQTFSVSLQIDIWDNLMRGKELQQKAQSIRNYKRYEK